MAKDFKQSDRQYYVSKNRKFVFIPLSLHVSYSNSISMVCQLKECDSSYITIGYSKAQIPLSSNYLKYNVMKPTGKRKDVKRKLINHYRKAV